MRPSRQRRDYHTLSAQGFRFYFTPLAGVLFTFPSRYLFAIGHRRVFSLRRWASRIQTEFHVFRSTWDTARRFQDFVHGPFTLCGKTFQNFTLSIHTYHIAVPQPQHRSAGLGCSPFVRHYLGNHMLFSIPSGTEMFHFPECSSTHPMYSGAGCLGLPGRVSPFGNLRVKAYLPLSEAYRSLSRPSSPSDAKAFTLCFL